MKMPFYSHYTPQSPIMAEQNPNGTWSVQGPGYGREGLPDEVFRSMYTDKAPHEYRKRPGQGGLIDPVALAEAGTHELVYCETKEHLDEIAEAHPETWFLTMKSGGAQQRSQMPSVWVGWVNPGEDIVQEKNAVYGFPLLAVIAKN